MYDEVDCSVDLDNLVFGEFLEEVLEEKLNLFDVLKSLKK